MDKKIKEMVEEYQCPGCIGGPALSCYEKGSDSIGCGKHCVGTSVSFVGQLFLGLPKGFCRLGACENTKISIFESIEKMRPAWEYNKFNIPVWKYLDKNGNTLVRGLCPRVNYPFLHIFIGDQMAKIDCLEITQKDIDEMD